MTVNGTQGQQETVQVTVSVQRRQGEALGLCMSENDAGVLVSRVLYGSPCARSVDEGGGLCKGDRLVAVNDIKLDGMTLDQVYSAFQSAGTELAISVLRDASARPLPDDPQDLVLRAPYDYDPDSDPLHPCPQFGLEFHRGDLIRVLQKDDPLWWQGHVLLSPGQGHSGALGVFPTDKCQRENPGSNEALPPFEAQVRLPENQRSRRRRLLVLLGPPGVGRHELRLGLIDSDPDRFVTPIQHTTRPRGENEVHGMDFLFVDQDGFNRVRDNVGFVETYQYDGHRYGISVEQLKASTRTANRKCILTLRAESLEPLRSHPEHFMPFAVFVKPPDDIAALRNLHSQLRQSDLQDSQTNDLSDEDLVAIISVGKRMEWKFGHLFDRVLEHEDFTEGLKQLKQWLGQRLTEEWVPQTWLTN